MTKKSNFILLLKESIRKVLQAYQGVMTKKENPILLLKEDIRKLLQAYQEGKVDLDELEDTAEEMSECLLDTNNKMELGIYQQGTVECVYIDILNTLESVAISRFFPEDVPTTLEYLNTKEREAEAAKRKWLEYWNSIDMIERGYEGMRRGYWHYTYGSKKEKIEEKFRCEKKDAPHKRYRDIADLPNGTSVEFRSENRFGYSTVTIIDPEKKVCEKITFI